MAAPWPWTLTFEVAFDTNVGDEPGAADWTDLSDRLRSPEDGVLGVDLGVGAARDDRAPGQGTITLNNRDRELDPTNTARVNGWNLEAMRHCRLSASVGGTDYPVFRGFVLDWPQSWPGPSDAYVQVPVVDGLVWFARVFEDVTLPLALSGERIATLVGAGGWPVGARDIDAGQVRLQAHDQEDANFLQLIWEAVDAEQGHLFVSPTGTVTFRDRHARLDAVSVLTLSPDGVKVSAATPMPSPRVNHARVELSDGVTWEYEDAASIQAIGEHTAEVRDLPLSKVESESLAQLLVIQGAERSWWLEGVQINGRPDGVLAQVLPVGLGDLVTFERTPMGVGGLIDLKLHVERIQHQIVGGSWTVIFDLSPYFGEGPWFTWDDPARGWDNAKWAP